ncbi:MAG: hypothetical protein ABR968_11445 [Bacteroidales bacterium]|jgi:hypothetical protein
MKKKILKSVPIGYGRFIMVAIPFTPSRKKLAKIKVSRAYQNDITTDLCAFGNGIKTTGVAPLNQPSATPPVNPVVTDTSLKSKSIALLNIHSGRQSQPPVNTAHDEGISKTGLVNDLDALASQVESIANRLAVAAGDVKVGEAFVLLVGFKLGGKGHGTAHAFKQKPSAKNTVLIQIPTAGKGAIHVLRVGKTTEDVIPSAWSNNIPIHTTELMVSGGGLKTGDILAVQRGVILTMASSILPAKEVAKPVSSLSTKSTKKKHQTPVYTYGTDPISWSIEILYAVVQ